MTPKDTGRFARSFSQIFTLEGNIAPLAVMNFLTGSHLVMLITVIQPFTLSLGGSVTFVGFLLTISAISIPAGILGSASPLVGGWLSDRSGRENVVILGSLLTILALFFYFLASYEKSPAWMLPGQVTIGLSFVRFPALLTLGAESVEPGRRTLAFSTLTFFSVLPGTFVSIVAGLIAIDYGYSLVFLVAIMLEVGSLVSTLFVRERVIESAEQGLAGSRIVSLRRIIIPPRHLRGFFLVNALDSFSWGIGAGIIYGMISQKFEFNAFQIALIEWTLVSVFTITQLPAGRLMQRRSRKVFMIFSEVLGIPLMIGWIFSNQVSHFIILSVVFGVSAPTWVPAVNTILANSVPRHMRGAASGQLAAFRGLFSFPGPLVGGLLFDNYGYNAPLLTGLAAMSITVVAIVVLVHEPAHADVSP